MRSDAALRARLRKVSCAWLGSWLPVGHHFQFETEMALLAAARPGRILNLPIPATYAREESKIIPWRDALNFARCLLRHRTSRVAPAWRVGEVSSMPANS